MMKKIKTYLTKVNVDTASIFSNIKRAWLFARALLKGLKSKPVFSSILMLFQLFQTVAITSAGYVFKFGQAIGVIRKIITVVVLFGVLVFNISALNIIGAQLFSQTRLGKYWNNHISWCFHVQ